ncbi:MAG: nitroreductase family protein [Planctomycetes bacterium]|nr:nitroreductase family protein [Planctomycetota bacterium]
MADPSHAPDDSPADPARAPGGGARATGASASGIPDAPAGDPAALAGDGESDEGAPPGPTPAHDFWSALYARRSVRKFEAKAVPRELVRQVLHAGIWAPSSCNYQMWDFVAVDDPEVNARLAQLSSQMGNAPVNVVVSYGRDFSEEGWANVQSASAAIQNMSLAAHVLGLGTFWITQMGDREQVREVVGLPEDRLVVAVLALGWPKIAPKKGPKRRPLAQVAHFNHYTGRPIPSSTNPADWAPDLLATYQRARVLNGLRHNKPRPWEVEALRSALEVLVPEGKDVSGSSTSSTNAHTAPRWLDVLPCTGIVTAELNRARPTFAFDVVERTREVAEFAAQRVVPHAGLFGLPTSLVSSPNAHTSPLGSGAAAPEPSSAAAKTTANALVEPPHGAYDVVSCFYRLENLPPAARAELVAAMARWVKPGGRVVIAFVSRRSYHDTTEWLRERRGGPGGVEYVLAPDPNIGPFESLEPADVESWCERAGLALTARFGAQPVPPESELAFRTRNFTGAQKKIAMAAGWLLGVLGRVPGLAARRGRFQFLVATRGR